MSYWASSSRTVLNHRGGEKKIRQKSKKKKDYFIKLKNRYLYVWMLLSKG